MNDLLEIHNGDVFASSIKIAVGVEYDHKTVIRLIRDKILALNVFGRVRFENAPFETKGGIQNREVALLNEPQTSLLLTFMRDNEIITAFKVKLIGAFYHMREMLAAPSPASDLDYGHTAELADHARVRLALKLGGKAYAIKLWNETAFGLKNPIAAVGGAPVKASAGYRGGEAYAVLCDFLDNPRYPALLHGQLQKYIIAACDLKPSYEELRVIIRQAGIATRCVRVGRHKVAKVKIFTDEVLTIADIRQSIADFKAAE